MAPQRAARVRVAEAVGAQRGVIARHPAADEVGDRPHVVAHGHERPFGARQLPRHVRDELLGLGVAQVVPLGLDRVAVELRPRGDRPDVGRHAPVRGEQLGGLLRPRHARARGEQLHARPRAGAGRDLVQAPEDALDVDALGLGRLHDRLVVDGQVIEDVLAFAVHAAQAVLHDVADLVAERRVVGHDRRVGVGHEDRVAVLVLEPLAVERGAPRRRADQEAVAQLVGRRPDRVGRALEAEHRIEDVERDHRLAERVVRGARGGERGHRTGLVDPQVQQLPLLRLLVRQEQVAVDRQVLLPVRGVDLRGREHGVHAEGAGLVRDDRHPALPDLLVAHEVLEQADERHGGGDLLLARAALGRLVGVVARQVQRDDRVLARGDRAAQLVAAGGQVLGLGTAVLGPEVRRPVRVGLQLLVGDRHGQGVAEALEVVQRQLLHLVGGVAALEGGAELVALDGVGEDDRRLALVLHGGPVRRVDLAVVVAAAAQVPDLVVAEVLDHGLGARVASEEVLADERAGLGLEGLVVAVGRGVHEVHQRAVGVGGEQRVPLAAPHDLDDVPARAAEVGLELLDDLAVAADRAVEALEVAVDDEGEVVELGAGGELERSPRLDLVHLAVAEEGPHLLLRGVLDAAVVRVAVEHRLVDRVDRAQTHRHGRELPVVGHQTRVRVGRQAALGAGDLLAEAVELVGRQTAFHKGSGVHAGRGVALEEHLVAAAGVAPSPEEVVVAHFVEVRGRGVGGDVAADADARALGPVDGHRGVPAHVGADALLDLLVAGVVRLVFDRDGVDVVGARRRGDGDLPFAGVFEQPLYYIAGTSPPACVKEAVQGFQPFAGLLGVSVRYLGRQSVTDGRPVLFRGHGRSLVLRLHCR